MKKILLLVFNILLLFNFDAFAQRDSAKAKPKYKSSAFDSSSVYYNVDILTINAGVGYFSYINEELYNQFGSPFYLPSSTVSPVYNLTLDYGIKYKATLGIGVSFQQVEDYSVNIYSIDERASVLNLGIRYTHCMGSWELLYYGFRLGTSLWWYKLSGNEVAANVSGNPIPIPIYMYSKTSTFSAQFLLGARLTFSKNVILHIEAGVLDPYTVEGGLTFRINMNKPGNKKRA